jgi:hypothetical protein
MLEVALNALPEILRREIDALEAVSPEALRGRAGCVSRDPLARVISRFGPAAVGVAASAAKAAMFDWLKKNFTKALDWM